MKKVIYLLSFLFVFSLNAQKNKNGVIYDKHPESFVFGPAFPSRALRGSKLSDASPFYLILDFP